MGSQRIKRLRGTNLVFLYEIVRQGRRRDLRPPERDGRKKDILTAVWAFHIGRAVCAAAQNLDFVTAVWAEPGYPYRAGMGFF